MNSSYKINIVEGEKSVKCEITVENEDKAKAILEAFEIYDEVSKYTKIKTTNKYLERN
jgi:hypothetical protein